MRRYGGYTLRTLYQEDCELIQLQQILHLGGVFESEQTPLEVNDYGQ